MNKHLIINQKSIPLNQDIKTTGSSSSSSLQNIYDTNRPFDTIDGSLWANLWNPGAKDTNAFNYDMKRLEYQSQLENKAYDNWYNSPAEQAKRMRQAGINPNLAGMQSSPSATLTSSGPAHAAEKPRGGLGDVLDLMAKIIGLSTQMQNQVISVDERKLDLAIKEKSYLNNLQIEQASGFQTVNDNGTLIDIPNYDTTTPSDYIYFNRKAGAYSPRQAKRLKDMLNGTPNDLVKKGLYDKLESIYNSKYGYLRAQNRQIDDGQFNLDNLNRDLVDAMIQEMRLEKTEERTGRRAKIAHDRKNTQLDSTFGKMLSSMAHGNQLDQNLLKLLLLDQNSNIHKFIPNVNDVLKIFSGKLKLPFKK